MDERCKNCSHWTSRKSEFEGWQLCDALNVWKHGADWCRQHKIKSAQVSQMTGNPTLSNE